MYFFKLYDNDNNQVWDIPFKSISITDRLNYGLNGTINIDYLSLKRYASIFNLTPDDVFASSLRDWRIYQDNNLRYGGILLHRKISGSGNQATSLTVNICDYLNALERRITGNAGTDWTYLSTDSADIAWDIIDQSQTKTNGDLGITRGLHPTTKDRDRTLRFDNIRDVIIKMSASEVDDGYDCEITPEKVFNIYYPKGEVKSNIILDDFNIISWSADKNLSGKLANSITVLGSGDGDDIITEVVEDTDSQEVWGLQEQTISAKDNEVSANLIDKGNNALNLLKIPQEIITVRVNDKNPDINTYNLGDTVTVKIDEIGLNTQLRIIQQSIQITPTGVALVDLSFDYE